MALTGEYVPSPEQWVRDQVALYESSGGTRGLTLRDTGLPVVIVTSLGARSGKIRKTPLMRVEHDGQYALVASQGGAPKHPTWYFNLLSHPSIELQDGPVRQDMVARQVEGDERTPVVGAGRRGVPQLRGLPGEDRARDPGLRRRTRLTPPAPLASALGQ